MNGFVRAASLAAVLVICFTTRTHAELKLLSVVHRHGDRAPDDNGLEMYPNDPYIKSNFEPEGLGGLTNKGKLREYALGQHIRKNYNNFLGDTYRPYEVKARSTNSDRTKMSLQLVLASLYPPKGNQVWSQLNWQPIPATYVPKLDDTLMIPEECPKYLLAREKVENSSEFKAKLDHFRNLMRELTQRTGKSISNSNDLYFLYHNFMAESSMNLELPKWSESIFPEGQLLDGINLEYDIFSYNTELRRLNGGMLLRKLIEDMEAYRSGALDNRRKLMIYSGHETNVAALLQALGVFKPHAPAYSSAVFVELHEENQEHFVKIKYYVGEPVGKHVEMTIPGCQESCSLDNVREILKDIIPSNEDIKCDKRSLREALEKNEIKVAGGIGKQILDEIYAEDKIRNTLV